MKTGRVSASQTLVLLTFVTALGLAPGAAAAAHPAAPPPPREGWLALRGAIASWLLPWLPGAAVSAAGGGGPNGYAALPAGGSGDPDGGERPPVPPPNVLAASELPPSEH